MILVMQSEREKDTCHYVKNISSTSEWPYWSFPVLLNQRIALRIYEEPQL